MKKSINDALNKIEQGKEISTELCVSAQSKPNGRKNNDIFMSSLTVYIFSKLIEHGGYYKTSSKELKEISGKSSTTINNYLNTLKENNLIEQYGHYSLREDGTPRMKNGKNFFTRGKYILIAKQGLADYLDERKHEFEFLDLDLLHKKGNEFMYDQSIIEEFDEDKCEWKVTIDGVVVRDFSKEESKLNEYQKWQQDVDTYEDDEITEKPTGSKSIVISPKQTIQNKKQLNRGQGKNQERKERGKLIYPPKSKSVNNTVSIKQTLSSVDDDEDDYAFNSK